MNFKHIIFAFASTAVAGLPLASCSDDFLDREPTNYITPDQMEQAMVWNSNIMFGQQQGTITKMVRWRSGGTDDQDDFGQKSTDICTDLMSGDMVMPGNDYGWFSDTWRLTTYSRTNRRSGILWKYNYGVINTCNSMLDALGHDRIMPEDNPTQQLYYAAAKTIRAYSYFNLVTLFGRNYTDQVEVNGAMIPSKDQKLLPIYHTQSGLLAPAAPQTVDSVYKFIFRELEGAIEAYEAAAENGAAPSDLSMPGLDVAYTIQAYAHLQRGDETKNDYALAQEAALNAIYSTDASMLTGNQIYFGMNTVNNPSWIWGVDITKDNTGGLCTWWGMMDVFTYSYAAVGDVKIINQELYDQMPESDARKKWFTEPGSYSGQLAFLSYTPMNKFYSASGASLGQLMADRQWVEDIVFMRIEEAWLLAAEASIRNNDLETGREALYGLLSERDPQTADEIETMTKDELLDCLYYNWRVEMWGEGRGLLTQKRFKRGNKRGTNDGAFPGRTFNYDDMRLYFSIPQSEYENNPELHK